MNSTMKRNIHELEQDDEIFIKKIIPKSLKCSQVVAVKTELKKGYERILKELEKGEIVKVVQWDDRPQLPALSDIEVQSQPFPPSIKVEIPEDESPEEIVTPSAAPTIHTFISNDSNRKVLFEQKLSKNEDNSSSLRGLLEQILGKSRNIEDSTLISDFSSKEKEGWNIDLDLTKDLNSCMKHENI